MAYFLHLELGTTRNSSSAKGSLEDINYGEMADLVYGLHTAAFIETFLFDGILAEAGLEYRLLDNTFHEWQESKPLASFEGTPLVRKRMQRRP